LENLVDEGVAQPPDRLLLAHLYEATGDWPRARQQLLTLLTQPGGKTPANLVAYVSALLRHGAVDEAEQVLPELDKVAADSLATVSLRSQVLHRRGQTAKAVALLKDHARKRGQEFGQVAVILEGLKEFGAARAMYLQHAERSPNPAARLAYAAFLARRKQVTQALEI